MFTVVAIGLRGTQSQHLTARLPNGIRLEECEPSRVLRVRGLRPDLVLCTRFVAHKHTRHLAEIAEAPVVWCQGGIGSWANTIIEHYNVMSAAKIRRAG